MNCRKGVLVQLTQYENEVWLVGEVLQTVAYGLPDVFCEQRLHYAVNSCVMLNYLSVGWRADVVFTTEYGIALLFPVVLSKDIQRTCEDSQKVNLPMSGIATTGRP
jgi:hypothetical protein